MASFPRKNAEAAEKEKKRLATNLHESARMRSVRGIVDFSSMQAFFISVAEMEKLRELRDLCG